MLVLVGNTGPHPLWCVYVENCMVGAGGILYRMCALSVIFRVGCSFSGVSVDYSRQGFSCPRSGAFYGRGSSYLLKYLWLTRAVQPRNYPPSSESHSCDRLIDSVLRPYGIAHQVKRPTAAKCRRGFGGIKSLSREEPQRSEGEPLPWQASSVANGAKEGASLSPKYRMPGVYGEPGLYGETGVYGDSEYIYIPLRVRIHMCIPVYMCALADLYPIEQGKQK